MKGGNIVGGQAEYGGGVRVEGSFTMEGGNIMGCRTEMSGGGVYVGNGTFTMNGGKIDNCSTYFDGDGIYFNGSSVMYASGGEVNVNIFIESNSRITAGTALDGATVFKSGVENTGTIEHGMFSGEVNSSGTISGGTFSDKVTNTGIISGGTFAETGTVANKIGSTISDCTFSGTVTVEVAIDSDNGSEIIYRDIPRGETFPRSDDPKKADHYFVGWYDGDTLFYFDEPIYDAVMVRARWEEGVPVPRLRINARTNEWEVSYDAGYTWTSLGVKATGEKGDAGTDGKDGKDGIDGKDGEKGEKGDKGDKGDVGADGKDGINGKDGTDGKNGIDGKNGADGNDGFNGKDGADGKNGIDGKDGADGKDGSDGKNGAEDKDGIGISSVTVDKDGSITVTLTDGSTHRAGSVPVTKEEVQELKITAGAAAVAAGVSLVGLLSAICYALMKRRKKLS